MLADDAMERIYGRIRLVRGSGSREKGELCIMTFTALLAGERHTDAPRTASPLIREFAIALNDALPDADRQRLKPFAPRIVGTRDGHDAKRSNLLRDALRYEVLPRLRADSAAGILRRGVVWRCTSGADSHDLSSDTIIWTSDTFSDAFDLPPNGHQMARLIARLLTTCAACASDEAAGSWYTAKAIDILDRLCEIGATARCALPPDGCASAANRPPPGRMALFPRFRVWITRLTGVAVDWRKTSETIAERAAAIDALPAADVSERIATPGSWTSWSAGVGNRTVEIKPDRDAHNAVVRQ
jgi:hypothetical protein